MPSVVSTLNEHFRKQARREVKSHLAEIRRQNAHHRRDVAALKRIHRQFVLRLEKLENNGYSHERNGLAPASPDPRDAMRFRVDGLKSHRTRLDLSALDFGRLIGVSGLTIYNWESGKSRPRRSQLAKIASIRGLGKREALKRLGTMK